MSLSLILSIAAGIVVGHTALVIIGALIRYATILARDPLSPQI